METKISVLLADPGEQYRAAYSKAIGQETDMELVAQTDNGLRAEELITKFQPDVVVLDLVLPNLDGLSLLTHLRAKNASSRVIVTSAICNDQVLMECAELGTTYFMQKPFDPPLLVQRIRQTARPRQRTGGAGTLYKSYTADSTDSGSQIWMCPYCVGSGYAMGLRQGAELSSLEQRWVATRTKDFCGPVDTISVGYGAPIINSLGERVMSRYASLGGDAAPRYIRANAPMEEWLNGRGPCFCDTTNMTPEKTKAMMEDYLNERPSFVLFLASRGQDPSKEPIEIFGSDPYIMGGHTGGGYWVDMERMTTLPGLFAAGETAGGNPNKFVGGCCAEGKLAARGALAYMAVTDAPELDAAQIAQEKERVYAPLLTREEEGVSPLEMKERLQRLMDEYAGGSSQFYRVNEQQLDYALRHIKILQSQFKHLRARDLHDLMQANETMDRVDVAEAVVHHLKARKETRWAGWQTRSDYPQRDDENFDCFVESRRDPATGEMTTFTRPYEQLLPGDRYKP